MKKTTQTAGAMFSLSELDIRKMIDAAVNIRDRIVIELLTYTGARRKELILIRVKDIDFENDRIFIATVKRRCDPYDALRPVPIIDARLKADLKVYLQLWETKYNLGKKDRLIQQCSCSRKNGLSTVCINQIVADVAEKAGVRSPNPNRGVHPHLFRHSFVRYARKFGLDFKVIQTIIGHASIATTFDMYGQPSWDEIKFEAQGKMADYGKMNMVRSDL